MRFSWVITAVVVVPLGGAALAGCGSSAPHPSPASSSVAPTSSPAPSPTPTDNAPLPERAAKALESLGTPAGFQKSAFCTGQAQCSGPGNTAYEWGFAKQSGTAATWSVENQYAAVRIYPDAAAAAKGLEGFSNAYKRVSGDFSGVSLEREGPADPGEKGHGTMSPAAHSDWKGFTAQRRSLLSGAHVPSSATNETAYASDIEARGNVVVQVVCSRTAAQLADETRCVDGIAPKLLQAMS